MMLLDAIEWLGHSGFRIDGGGWIVPAATEIVCAVGAEADLVGISHECDFPEAVRGLPALTRARVHPVGTSREIDRDGLSVRFGNLWAAQDGLVAPGYDEAKMSAYMKNKELEVTVDVGVGRASAAVWTCDLTKRYVEINGDYRS